MRTVSGWAPSRGQALQQRPSCTAAGARNRLVAPRPSGRRQRNMADSARRPQYGAPCAAAGNGQLQPAAAAAAHGNWAAERQHPGGSVDIDASSICDQAQCPFPLHDAFSAERKEGRLRNQVCSCCRTGRPAGWTAMLWCRWSLTVLLALTVRHSSTCTKHTHNSLLDGQDSAMCRCS